MKSSLIVEANQKPGLDASKNITRNPSGSVNHVLKEATEYERDMTLAEFIARNCTSSCRRAAAGAIENCRKEGKVLL